MKRIHVIVSGKVQGLGYRAWVVRIGNLEGLTGWVKNLDDGSVEIVSEGEKNDLQVFTDRLWDGPGGSKVEDVNIEWQEATDEFVEFEIIY